MKDENEKLTDKRIADHTNMLLHLLAGPLNVIKHGIANILSRRVADDKMFKRLEHIENIIEHVMQQLNTFRNLSDIETGYFRPMEKRTESLHRFLIQRVSGFQVIANERGLSIEVRPIAKNQILMETDFHILTQIINILLDNAVKYSFSKDEIVQLGLDTPPKVLIDFDQSKTRIIIKMTNWGYEPTDMDKQKMFERNYRGKNAERHSPVGLGLGLYAVKKFVHVLNGEISFENSGNKISFILKFKKADDKE